MASKSLNVTILTRSDTEANFSTTNPVLAAGEMAISTDKGNLFKVGDGVNTWADLAYNTVSWDQIVNKPSANGIGYNNATSHLTGDNVQTAIDEIKGLIDAGAGIDTTYTFANGTNGFTVTPSNGSAQTVTVTPNDSTKLPLAGGTLTGRTVFNNISMPIVNGRIDGLNAGTTEVFKDGVGISNPGTQYDCGWVRVCGTGEKDTVLEIATGDDGGGENAESIVARQYNTSSAVVHQFIILDGSGNTTVPGNITFEAFATGNKGIGGTMGSNDAWRIHGIADAANATADDTTEPIYVRQYSGSFATVARTATLLDGSGNTSFPGTVSAGGVRLANVNELGSYLPKSGGALSGSLTFANGTWNVVGDDCAIGDINAAGTLGVKGQNGNTCIRLVPYSGSSYQEIKINGSNTMTITGNVNTTGTLSQNGSNVALKSDISTLQSNFQAGVNSVYNAVVAKGVTPASTSLSDIVTAIGQISGTKSVPYNIDIKGDSSGSHTINITFGNTKVVDNTRVYYSDGLQRSGSITY